MNKKQKSIPKSNKKTTHVNMRKFGQQAADSVANTVGSWRFIIIQSTIIIAWITFNLVSSSRVDPYPFILLNLLLSFQAAYTAPMIMMSQNRQGEIDRKREIKDFEINKMAKKEIEEMQVELLELKQHIIIDPEFKDKIHIISDQLNDLKDKLDQLNRP